MDPRELRAQISGSADIEKDTRDALTSVLDMAIERYGDHPGFTVVLAFADYAKFLETVEVRDVAEREGRDLGRHIAAVLEEEDQTYLFTEMALAGSLEPNNPDAIANRIRVQMDADTLAVPTYRKPVQYVAGNDYGFAVCVAIDDRFWTDEW